MAEPYFPSILDSSILSTAKACRRKFFLEYVSDWKPKEPSVHLHAGAAFAAGLEAARSAYYTGHASVAEAEAIGAGVLLQHYGDFECPEDSAKSATRMVGALEFYFANYPLDTDAAQPITLPGGKRGIEISFAEPLPIAHPVTGDPLIYCGRLDMAVNYAGGIYVEDDKTTSSLGATWSKQWDLRSQFTGYCWGLNRVAGVKPTGCLVRGISILKTKYDTLQSITYRPDWMIDEWFSETCDLVEDLVRDWKRSMWRKTSDGACNDYGGCLFRGPCGIKDPTGYLETHYERRRWNPLKREELKL